MLSLGYLFTCLFFFIENVLGMTLFYHHYLFIRDLFIQEEFLTFTTGLMFLRDAFIKKKPCIFTFKI